MNHWRERGRHPQDAFARLNVCSPFKFFSPFMEPFSPTRLGPQRDGLSGEGDRGCRSNNDKKKVAYWTVSSWEFSTQRGEMSTCSSIPG